MTIFVGTTGTMMAEEKPLLMKTRDSRLDVFTACFLYSLFY